MLPRENIQVLDNKSIWNYGSFFYNHYPVFDCVKWLICIFKVMSSIDANIITGQNAASSEEVAKKIVALLKEVKQKPMLQT